MGVTYLNLEQRIRRVRKRVSELEFWVPRQVLPLDHWTLNGQPHAVGQAWPSIDGTFRFAHPPVAIPGDWPLANVRLRLDLGGEGLLTIKGADWGRQKIWPRSISHQLSGAGRWIRDFSRRASADCRSACRRAARA